MKSLDSKLSEILDSYKEEVLEITNDAIEETAKDTVLMLKNSGEFKDKRPKYRKSWAKKDGKVSMGIKSVTVYNKEHQLTHLLEYGHVSRNGKRTRAFPHIGKVEEKAEELLIKRIEDKLWA